MLEAHLGRNPTVMFPGFLAVRISDAPWVVGRKGRSKNIAIGLELAALRVTPVWPSWRCIHVSCAKGSHFMEKKKNPLLLLMAELI